MSAEETNLAQSLRKSLGDFMKKSSKDVDQENFEKFKSQVLLDPSKYKNLIGPAIVLFYRTSCPFCRDYKGTFVQLYNYIKEWNKTNPKIKVYAIDTENREKVKSIMNNIEGVPTLVLVDANGDKEVYNGSKSNDVLLPYIKQYFQQ